MRSLSVLVAICVSLGLPAVIFANSSNTSSDCSGCHTTPRAGAISLIGTSTTANPTEVAGHTNLGTLPVYQVQAGQTIPLQARISGLPSNDNFGLILRGFTETGVTNNATLTFTPDTTGWSNRTVDSIPFKALSPSIAAYTAPVTFTYDLAVSASTPSGYYPMSFMLGGGPEDYYDLEPFYLQVTPEPASMALLALGGLGVLLRRRRRQ